MTCIYLVRTPRDKAYSTEAFKETLLRRGASGYVAGDVKAAFSKEKKDGKEPKEEKARLVEHTDEKKFKKKKKDKKSKVEKEEKSEIVKEKGDSKATKKWVKKSKTKDSSI